MRRHCRGVVPIGRTAVSKTDGYGFESCRPCHFLSQYSFVPLRNQDMHTNWLCSLFDIELLQLKQKNDSQKSLPSQLQNDLNFVLASNDIKVELCALNVPFKVERSRIKVNNQGLTSAEKRALWQTLWHHIQ